MACRPLQPPVITWSIQSVPVRARDGPRRLLLRTEGAPLTPVAATWLVRRGVRLVGVDALSVDPVGANDLAVHRELLGNGVVVVEGLLLAGVAQGRYTLVCLPLRLADGDGAPARVVLIHGRRYFQVAERGENAAHGTFERVARLEPVIGVAR